MENKNFFEKIASAFVSVIKWTSGFFQDQAENTSSKRLVLYAFVYIFYEEMKQSFIAGMKLDTNLFWGTVAIIAFLIGAVTSEFFNKLIDK